MLESDIVFMVDTSLGLDMLELQSFLISLIRLIDVGSSLARVGIIGFSDNITNELALGQYSQEQIEVSKHKMSILSVEIHP